MKPPVGVIPLYDENRESYWMLPGYMKVLEKNGALPLMLPLTDDKEELNELLPMFKGFLFTGGHDVDPAVYGARRSKECGVSCGVRDRMEAIILDYAMEKDVPVLGICRGVQFINAHLGGTLYQDLPGEYDSNIDHHMTPPYDRAVHGIKIYPDTRLADILGEGEHQVNSYHHQAVKDVSEKVNVSARSEDGLAEAVEVKDKKFIIGVQWHPEFSYEVNEESNKLITAFINACNI